MATDALRIASLRRRELRLLFGVSLLAHAGLAGLFAVAPKPGFRMPPGVVSVELVGLPALQPARPPAAAPRPKPPKALPPKPEPKPEPKPPVPQKVVLPKNPSERASKPKPRPQRPPEPPPELEEPVEKEYTDVLSELRSELGEEEPVPQAKPTPAPAPAAGGPGVAVSPEVAAWMRKVKVHVRRAWVVPPGFRAQSLETHVLVRLDASGQVIGEPRIVRASGNPWYDEGVVRAIEKASPLPPPPQADEWPFVFVPQDSY